MKETTKMNNTHNKKAQLKLVKKIPKSDLKNKSDELVVKWRSICPQDTPPQSIGMAGIEMFMHACLTFSMDKIQMVRLAAEMINITDAEWRDTDEPFGK